MSGLTSAERWWLRDNKCRIEKVGDVYYCLHKNFTNFKKSERYGMGDSESDAIDNYLERKAKRGGEKWA